jgi:hypothetical protein
MGRRCPFAAHIRKAYPRDDITPAGDRKKTEFEKRKISDMMTIFTIFAIFAIGWAVLYIAYGLCHIRAIRWCFSREGRQAPH